MTVNPVRGAMSGLATTARARKRLPLVVVAIAATA
jgi:hypothetical protein